MGADFLSLLSFGWPAGEAHSRPGRLPSGFPPSWRKEPARRWTRSSHWLVQAICLGLLLPLCPLSAQPQSGQDEPHQLRLHEVVQRAMANNYDIRLQLQDVKSAEVANTWGNAGRMPHITLQGTNNNQFQNLENPASPFGAAQIWDIGFNATVNANWVVFNGFRTWISKERLELLEDFSAGNAELIIENTLQALLLAYYDVLIARERLQVLQRTAAFSEDRLGYVRDQNGFGTATTFEVLQEEINRDNDQVNLVNQRLVLKNAKRELTRLMGEEPPFRFRLLDSLRLDTTNYRFEDLRRQMKNAVDMEQQHLNLQIRQRELELARRQMTPTLEFDLGSGITRNFGSVDGPDFNRSGWGTTPNYYANFTLSFNIFNGGATRRAIEQAQIERQKSIITREQVRQDLSLRLKEALDTYNTRKELYRRRTAIAEKTARNLALTRERFRTGTVNSFDFREVQLTHLQAELSRLQAISDLKAAETDLLRLTGGLMRRLPGRPPPELEGSE